MIDATVRPAELVSDFINYILYSNARPTLLIVCSTRAQFLSQLAASISIQQQRLQDYRVADEPERDIEDTDESGLAPESIQSPHPLLAKSIGLIAQSRKVKLVFCPSVDRLRAYLSTFHVRRKEKQGGTTDSTKDESDNGLLAILDLAATHYVSLEFSAQGLSRTLSIAVEAAAREATDLLLCECNDAVVPQNPGRGQRLWDLHVPLLSSTLRVGDGGTSWTGRHVSVRRVARRWFRFEESEPNVADEMDI
jgi:hypothetical protein